MATNQPGAALVRRVYNSSAGGPPWKGTRAYLVDVVVPCGLLALVAGLLPVERRWSVGAPVLLGTDALLVALFVSLKLVWASSGWGPAPTWPMKSDGTAISFARLFLTMFLFCGAVSLAAWRAKLKADAANA
jgi:hypothetical protein